MLKEAQSEVGHRAARSVRWFNGFYLLDSAIAILSKLHKVHTFGL